MWEGEGIRRCFSVEGTGEPMTPCSPGDKKKWHSRQRDWPEERHGQGEVRVRVAGAQTPRPRGRDQQGQGSDGLTSQPQELGFIS